jgi:hypothetical protein
MCMTDTSGISGGCQDLYTVYPSANTTCRNVTVPATILGVKMTSSMSGGLLSRYGWPASCSDLQFQLIDGFGGGVVGTPPYTLTVAPAFRTPVNITFRELPPFLDDSGLMLFQRRRRNGLWCLTTVIRFLCQSQTARVHRGRTDHYTLGVAPLIVLDPHHRIRGSRSASA